MHASEQPEDPGRTEGRYANYFEVGFNGLEFVLDFGQFYQGGPRPMIHTRIVTNSVYGYALFRTLQDAIAQHREQVGGSEDANGEIRVASQREPGPDGVGFGER